MGLAKQSSDGLVWLTVLWTCSTFACGAVDIHVKWRNVLYQRSTLVSLPFIWLRHTMTSDKVRLSGLIRNTSPCKVTQGHAGVACVESAIVPWNLLDPVTCRYTLRECRFLNVYDKLPGSRSCSLCYVYKGKLQMEKTKRAPTKLLVTISYTLIHSYTLLCMSIKIIDVIQMGIGQIIHYKQSFSGNQSLWGKLVYLASCHLEWWRPP